MQRFWLVLVLGVFIVTFAGLVALRRQAPGNSVSTSTSDSTSAAVCDGCGVAEGYERFGVGRVAGETVVLPDSAPKGPMIVVTASEDCDYCTVPIATVALALEHLEGTTCSSTVRPSLVVLGAREADVMYAQSLVGRVPSASIQATAEAKSAEWRSVLSTDIVPTTLVLDSEATVVAEWVGFDPGHGQDLMEAVRRAAACSGLPATPLRSALSAVAPGDIVPAWILAETGLLNSLPATLVFSDANCSVCVLMQESALELLGDFEARGIRGVYVDASPSLEHLAARQNHMHALLETPFGSDLAAAFPDIGDMQSVYSSTNGQSKGSEEVRVHFDGSRNVVTALVGGVVPSAVVIGADGRIQHRLVYRLGEAQPEYLDRLASAAATR